MAAQEMRPLKTRLKNALVKGILEEIKDMKIRQFAKTRKESLEVGVPVGVIAGLDSINQPDINSYVQGFDRFGRQEAVLPSPHPNALKSIEETVEHQEMLAVQMDISDSRVSIAATNELMRRDTNLLLGDWRKCHGQSGLPSGTPAIGVGPGNGPAFIERTADVLQSSSSDFGF